MIIPRPQTLLTPEQMNQADKDAARSGIDSYGLMEKAGRAVAATALARFPQARRMVVLCGPGNNGGDGYVAARALAESGVAVDVYRLGDPEALRGDAARAQTAWAGVAQDLEAYHPQPGDLVIDALFGAGLSRAVPAEVASIIDRITQAAVPVLAVDLPSGVDGRTGQILGAAFKAACTVTFMARKPGHLLLPGRALCGPVEVHDIGIPWRIVSSAAGGSNGSSMPWLAENTPALWCDHLPVANFGQHKFTRGHLVVFSGTATATGAARLSAQAGLRAGAGLVTIAAPTEALAANAAHLTAVMLRAVDTSADLRRWLDDARLRTFVLGPGFGLGPDEGGSDQGEGPGAKARSFVTSLAGRNLVLDADGITAFRHAPQKLFDLFRAKDQTPARDTNYGQLVLTPHEGEFARLFPDIADDSDAGKVEKTRAAAERSGAVIVYKGADTVVAEPDGRAVINTNAPPWLATAGSGDTLAGIIGALLAQGVPAFEAAAAGVYLHGEAAERVGPGMTAEDLADAVGPFDPSA